MLFIACLCMHIYSIYYIFMAVDGEEIENSVDSLKLKTTDSMESSIEKG